MLPESAYSGCPHCGRPVRPDEDHVFFRSCFLPAWEILCNRLDMTFHRACWLAWPLRERYIRRVNAVGGYTLHEDGTTTRGKGGYWPSADPRPGTLAVGQLTGVLREACGPLLAGDPWSAKVSVDYLEESRFHARFTLVGYGWVGASVVVDVANPADHDAVLGQAEAAVARSIESRHIAAFFSNHPNGRKRLFKATPGMAWSMTGDWPSFSVSSSAGRSTTIS